MKWGLELARRVQRLLFWRREEAEMDEEIRFHLEMEAANNARNGIPAPEASRHAVLAFGGVDAYREKIRDSRGLPALEDFWRDIRYGFRHLRRSAYSTSTVLLVLALGIGANIAVFTIYTSVVNAPEPGVPPDKSLVRIRGSAMHPPYGLNQRYMFEDEVAEYATHKDVFSSVASWERAGDLVVQFADPGKASVSAAAIFVSPNYFTVLGVRPVLGPGLPLTAQSSEALLGLISHELWQQHFGGRLDVIGKTVRLNGQIVEIVGVGPRDFQSGINGRNGLGVWMLEDAREIVSPRAVIPGAGESPRPTLQAVALLTPGVEIRRASAIAMSIGAGASADRYATDPSADVVPFLASNESANFEGLTVRAAAVYGGFTTLILLITCTNVSALLVGVTLKRGQEIAVRLSIGATRRRIIRQLLTESILVSLGAAALALGVCWLILLAFGKYVDIRVPLQIDWRAIVFTLFFAIGTGIVFGLSPALHATRRNLGDVLKLSAATVLGAQSRLQRGLVVAQIALTQPLLVGLAVLLAVVIQGMNSQGSSDLNEQIASIEFSYAGWTGDREEVQRQMERLEEGLRRAPGVLGAIRQSDVNSGLSVFAPPDEQSGGADLNEIQATTHQILPGYLAFTGTRIIHGREFTSDDVVAANDPVVVGSELAAALWGSADPVGRRLQHSGTNGEVFSMTVIGVFDQRTAPTLSPDRPVILNPAGETMMMRTILVKTVTPAQTRLADLRRIASEIEPGIPVEQAATLAQIEAETRSMMMKASAAAGAGGLLALILSGIGLHAVVSYAVLSRRREIGIRTAMGACIGQVVRMFFLSGLRLSTYGLLLGMPLSLLAIKLFAEAQGIPLSGWMVAAVVSVSVILLASLASWIPARRAAAVDPLISLRSE